MEQIPRAVELVPRKYFRVADSAWFSELLSNKCSDMKVISAQYETFNPNGRSGFYRTNSLGGRHASAGGRDVPGQCGPGNLKSRPAGSGHRCTGLDEQTRRTVFRSRSAATLLR